MLEVEHPRERQRRVAQLGVLERMADPLAAQPDLAAALAQPVEELLPGAGARRLPDQRHQSPPAGTGSCNGASGCPSASRPWRSQSTAAASKRKYERGGRMPQVFDEWASSGQVRGS